MAEYYRYKIVERTEPRRYRDTASEYADDVREYVRPARTELVRRAREDSDLSIEDIQREFPPGQDYTRREDRPRGRARSYDRGRAYDDDDYYYAAAVPYGRDPRRPDGDMASIRSGRRPGRDRSRDKSLGRVAEIAAAAAGAGLAVGGKELWDRKHRNRSRSSSSSRSRSRSRAGIGQKLALGVAGAVAGDLAARQYAKRRGSSSSSSDDDRYDARRARQRRGSEGYYRDDDYAERPRPSRRKSLGEAALGALGLKEIVRGSSRHRRRGSGDSEYSRSSTPDKAEKIQQAALAALAGAATEAWRSRNEPGGYLHGDKGRRILTAAAGAAGVDALVDRDPDRHEARHVGEGVAGGLLINQLVNGSRRDDGPRRSRSGRHGRSRSRSRSHGGGLKDIAAAGLAAGAAKKLLGDRSRSRSRSHSRSRRGRRYSESPPRRRKRSKSVGDRLEEGMAAVGLGAVADKIRQRSQSRKRGDAPPSNQARGPPSPIDSDFDLEEEEKARRKLRGKEFVTAGLATIATVHAAHELYDEVEKGRQRHAAVKAGEISPEEAKKQKRMAFAKDAAAAGLAVLGVKGVVENWKDMTEKRKEIREYEQKLAEHRRIASERCRGLGRNQSFHRSAPDLRDDDRYGHDDDYYGNGNGDRDRGRRGPVYHDGNPYAAMR